MRIGYSFWGFLGDYKEDEQGNPLSTPDGNAAYGWSIIWEATQRDHEVHLMQIDRDWPVYQRRKASAFSSFSKDKRYGAYLSTIQSGDKLPKLDMLFLEWRFPIPGRNTPADKGSPNYQPDLERQNELLHHYRDIPIVIWDLDHKLTLQDEQTLLIECKHVTIFETSVTPRSGFIKRVRVEPPVVVDDLLQYPQKDADPNRKLVYVGSRYERDDVINEWIRPVSDMFPQHIEFWGNWTREDNFEQVRKMWPNIKYCDRITMKDFDKAYGTAVAVPLLAKKGYLETGFITPRIWEAIIFGSIPVGLATHHGIEQYLPEKLIARNPEHLGRIVEELSYTSTADRGVIRAELAKKISFMDVKDFINKLESAA